MITFLQVSLALLRVAKNAYACNLFPFSCRSSSSIVAYYEMLVKSVQTLLIFPQFMPYNISLFNDLPNFNVQKQHNYLCLWSISWRLGLLSICIDNLIYSLRHILNSCIISLKQLQVCCSCYGFSHCSEESFS